MDYGDIGFVRIGAASPEVVLAHPAANAERILASYRVLADEGCSVVLTPELSLTGYSCEDLFPGTELLSQTEAALVSLARQTGSSALIVGAPFRLPDSRLLNCAFVCANGAVLGAVPKSVLPNTGEFYDRRWFASGAEISIEMQCASASYWVDPRQIFRIGAARFAIEICEDLWAPSPPGVDHAIAGATVILNPSASNELVAKAAYRRDLVRMQSAKSIAGYFYAGAGLWESTKDTVFGGHLIACENGQVLGESSRLQRFCQHFIADFDCEKLQYQRTLNSGFRSARRAGGYRTVDIGPAPPLAKLARSIDPHPFVPSVQADFDEHANEVLRIQAMGLLRRCSAANTWKLIVGISGGLDSTLALLVCYEVMAEIGRDNLEVIPVTMPGPATSDHTLATAEGLAKAFGADLRTITITAAVEQHLSDIGHTGAADRTLENAQARERTQILFDLANQEEGLVVGTGDMSELALGWCTFNADHIASYSVNAGVPKTLVASLIEWYADTRADAELKVQLRRVLDTPISPELIPGPDGEIGQQTEAILGAFEVHDFYLYQYFRGGASTRRMYELAKLAFAEKHPPESLRNWLKIFLTRFYAQQFKRTTLPPGPKVGTVSLSPRGDWRMPDEANIEIVLENIDALDD